MVEICLLAVERDVDVVAADFFGFVVERLRYVAEEVDEELEGLLGVGGGEAAVLDALGL